METDPRGALTGITEEKVRLAARLVRRGEVIALSHPLDWPPREGDGDSRLFRPALRRENIVTNNPFPLRDGRYAVANDDVVRLSLQGSSHWDALAHFGVLEPGRPGVFYGDRPLEEAGAAGARTLGIDAAAGGIVTRGVLFDMVGFLGRAEPGYLEDSTRITDAMLDGFLAEHGLELERGDAALIYTGFFPRWVANGGAIPAAIAGLDGSSMRLWRESGVAALASDNPTLDAAPMDHSVHIGALRELGVMLGEYWALDALAAACRGDGVYEFLLA
ncbi:MAG: cyclase family protein, partial [Candidatus Woesearchaeota archaeon]